MFKAAADLILIEPVYDGMAGLIYVHDRDREYIGDFYGVVVAVGPEYKHGLKAGDRVRFRRHEGYKIVHEGKNLLVLKDRWADAIDLSA